MHAGPPLIPYLRNVRLWVWLGIVGGGVVFLGILAILFASYPGTPPHEVDGWDKAWLFLLPVAMAAYGLYVSARYWRCPGCGQSLPTDSAVPARCPRCGAALHA